MAGILDFLGGQQNSPLYTASQNFSGNIREGGGLLSSFLNAAHGYQTGTRTDPVGMYQQMAGLTYNALLQAGVPEPQAKLGAINPEVQKAITAKMFPTYAAHNVGNTTGSFNPATGQFQPQYVAPEFKTINPGDTGISYQPPLTGAAPGPMGVPRPAPVQTAPLAPPPGGPQAGPMPGGPGPPPGSPALGGGTQVIAPGMSLQEKEAAIERGKLQGQAQGNLPKAEATATQALGIIDQIQTHPGRNFLSTGPMAGTAQYQKGSPQYDFSRLVEQAKSGAFLSAFATLRGGGAISDAEGRKATDALARMDPAQTKEGFNKALADYRSVIQTGLQNQQRIARGDMQPYPTTSMPAPAQAAPVGQGRVPPAKAIDALKADPSRRGEFDAYYGPGSANKVLGGG